MDIGHLTAENLLDYYEKLWTTDQSRQIEEHLAGCNECAELARKTFVNNGIYEQWIAHVQKQHINIGNQ